MATMDTTAEASALQLEIQRRLGAAGRFRAAIQMSETVRAFAISGIKRRHPELDEAGVAAQLTRDLYGVEVMRR